jgi:hypothetical protein
MCKRQHMCFMTYRPQVVKNLVLAITSTSIDDDLVTKYFHDSCLPCWWSRCFGHVKPCPFSRLLEGPWSTESTYIYTYIVVVVVVRTFQYERRSYQISVCVPRQRAATRYHCMTRSETKMFRAVVVVFQKRTHESYF